MKILIKSALITDPRSSLNGKKRDILIENGKITKIATNIKANKVELIDAKGIHVSPGWIDLRAHFRDPGEEHKEDLRSGLDAAARGGFTRVVVMPDTYPPISNKSSVEYILQKSKGHVVEAIPSGTVSKDLSGENLSEMMDMHKSGARIFTDNKHSVDRTELMLRVLEYAKNFKGRIMTVPFDHGICPGGQMHEGKESTALGMKGIPEISETMRLSRDLEILRYTGSKLHVSLLSSKSSVELIRKAKKEGLNLSADVCAHQLAHTDKDLKDFDSNFKVNPPYRTSNDVSGLVKGIKDGTIDAICSDHSPQDIEEKKREYQHAGSGISSIETTFSKALEFLEKDVSLEVIIEKLTYGPASILEVDVPTIEKGARANLTVFDPKENWTSERKTWLSKSQNNPYFNTDLKGKVKAVIREKEMRRFS